jgi:uncharacterized protein
MQQTDGRLILSPSDLSGFLACRHLTRLDLSVARGEQKRPVFDDKHREILGRKGIEHELAYLARLERDGRRILHLPTYHKKEGGFDSESARRLTEEAIRAGEHDYLYQAYLADGDWQGFADFLERREDGSYEPVDAKLARAAKPEHVLQLCFYAEQIERIQGRLPEHVHAELGSGERESFRTAEYMAYYRRVRSRFLEALRDSTTETYPWKCERCGICPWHRKCYEKLMADDNLTLVAGLGRTYVPRLEAVGLPTLEKLGDAASDHARDGLAAEIFEKLRHQASLQLFHRRTKVHKVELLDAEPNRGFDLLPEPSPGDVWLDLEGHPFFDLDRSLEYLFGYCVRGPEGKPEYRSLWATDRDGERAIFEQFVDFVVERRRKFPEMHVYHYANYERSALQRLMGEHGTREEEIDDLLRGEVLVDLYRVVQQSLRASVESYSLKKIEALYEFKREADVKGGAESTVLFEQWLETRDQSLLDEIGLYNEEDCRSTFELHEWLIGLRPPETMWRPLPAPAAERQDAEQSEERERLKAALTQRSRKEGDVPWLLAQLLEYHKREARPQWWHWFNRLAMDDEELIRDTNTMGGLAVRGTPTTEKQSHVYTFTFPPQDHKIHGDVVDPASRKGFVAEVDEENGIVRLKRGHKRVNEPLPRALVPKAPLSDNAQREALIRFAKSFLADDGAYPALADLVARRPPRVDLSLAPPEAALTLDRSYLFVQGPPGSGKTWQGAKAAVALMRAGKRIGVTALSHKAINKLLGEIEREALAQGFAFRGRKKHTSEDHAHRGPFIESSDKTEDMLDRTLQLIAGTGWLFAPKQFDHSVDVLFIDEAGQVSLADAVASGTAATSLVLLGDPNQLPQVSQGVQPEAAKKSVLEHLLGEDHTVPPDRGIFLAKTWRLRPELCAFNSEAYYEDRLEPAAVAGKRSLEAGNGLHIQPVVHDGRSQSSREEAEAIAAEIGRLLGTSFTDGSGRSRALTVEDVLVVTPYNAQVRTIRSLVPKDVRVGTVDIFQGQEAAAVLVSFASSSGADAPRGIGFAFEPHRVNVATSRGQCRVVVFCAPELLQAECKTIEQMRLMNAICRFVELAGEPLS